MANSERRRFSGIVAIVTEPATALGRDTAERLARDGADLILMQSVDAAEYAEGAVHVRAVCRLVEQTAEAAGVLATSLVVRAGDERHLRDMIDFALEDFDRVDLAIIIDPTSDLPRDIATAERLNWESDPGQPLMRVRRTAATVAPYLSRSTKGGALLLVTSTEADDASREHLQRQAISIAVQSLASDLSDLGVRVNAVVRVPDSRLDPQMGSSPGSVGDSDVGVVSAALWLSSHEAVTLSGVTIPVGPSVVRNPRRAIVRS